MQCQNQTKQSKKKQKKDLKIIAVSDLHGFYDPCARVMYDQGDIFIIAGDFSYYSADEDYDTLINFLGNLKFKYKIVISGNHQIALDNGTMDQKHKQTIFKQHPFTYKKQDIIKRIKQKAIYLEHEYIEIQGLKIFASPYTPIYSTLAFQYQPQYAQIIWNQIPKNLDILITHGPPNGILDKSKKDKIGGCPVLLKKVQQIKPKFHIFGHIHQAHGTVKIGQTTFMNVSYKPEFIKFQQ